LLEQLKLASRGVSGGDRTSNHAVATGQARGRNPALMPQVRIPVVEAQGWIMSADGKIALTANAPNVVSQTSWYKPLLAVSELQKLYRSKADSSC
jgi:hypothetical protein